MKEQLNDEGASFFRGLCYGLMFSMMMYCVVAAGVWLLKW